MTFQLVERPVPAFLVAAAGLLVVQARMGEGELGAFGNGAKIAAYSVVARGTVIPPDEVWGGIPARKLSCASEAQSPLSPDRAFTS